MKTQNPLIGRSKKSFGEATFYTMNGQNIVRTKPVAVANPNTPAQEMQRVRFTGFTGCANSLPQNDLDFLFPVKNPRQNKRSTLQQQLSPAYGATVNTDPAAASRFVFTFNADLLDSIGTGEVGFIGDLAQATIDADNISFTGAETQKLVDGLVSPTGTDEILLVIFSEDGCIMRLKDTTQDFATLEDLAAGDGLTIDGGLGFRDHGTKIFAYAIAAQMQTTGLGTFAVAERKARKGHNPLHGRGITPA